MFETTNQINMVIWGMVLFCRFTTLLCMLIWCSLYMYCVIYIVTFMTSLTSTEASKTSLGTNGPRSLLKGNLRQQRR